MYLSVFCFSDDKANSSRFHSQQQIQSAQEQNHTNDKRHFNSDVSVVIRLSENSIPDRRPDYDAQRFHHRDSSIQRLGVVRREEARAERTECFWKVHGVRHHHQVQDKHRTTGR